MHVSIRIVCLSHRFLYRDDGDDFGSGGYSALNISGPMVTGNTIWYNDVLNCLGNEVCLVRCLSYIPAIAIDQCSSEVGVRCSK